MSSRFDDQRGGPAPDATEIICGGIPMRITREESQKLYDQYLPRIRDAVDKFREKISFADWEFPELEQVAWLAFYDLIDRLDNLDHLRTVYYNAIFSRLYYHFEHKSMINIPHKKFYEEIKKHKRMPLEDVPESRLADRADDPAQIADNSRFMQMLTDEQRRIVELLLQGYSHMEISELMGGDSIDRHYRQLRKIRAKYKEYFPKESGSEEV